MLPLSRPADRSAVMPRSARPALKALRRACAVAAVALIPVLAGCEAGGDAPILNWHPPTSGASATIIAGGGQIAIRNAFILGGVPNFTLPAGSSASMFVGLVNTGPRDRLIRVSAPGAATSVTLPTGGVLLKRDSSALLTGPAPELVLSDLTQSLTSGTYVRVLFTFQKAGTISLTLPVIQRADSFATFSPAPRPTPSVSATGKRQPGQASATPTPTVTATPTG
jgi:copper(I)-binding protein